MKYASAFLCQLTNFSSRKYHQYLIGSICSPHSPCLDGGCHRSLSPLGCPLPKPIHHKLLSSVTALHISSPEPDSIAATPPFRVPLRPTPLPAQPSSSTSAQLSSPAVQSSIKSPPAPHTWPGTDVETAPLRHVLCISDAPPPVDPPPPTAAGRPRRVAVLGNGVASIRRGRSRER